jgi:hypothetical protein
MLRREQRFHVQRFEYWADLARWAYNVAILALTVGVGAILVPNGHISGGRWVAIGLASVAFIAEAVWIAAATFKTAQIELPEVQPEA